MSEIRVNIITKYQTISGDLHGSFGDVMVASLTAEPETIEELETAIQRFISKESDWSFFRSFKKYENLEPYDAGILVIDLSAKVLIKDSTYSYYSREGNICIRTEDNGACALSYKLSDDWKYVRSLPEYKGTAKSRREYFQNNPPFDARQVLFGQPLYEFIVSEYLANKNSQDKDLFTNIHAKWLMTERADLYGQTPREVLLEKHDFIDSDLQSRSLQWSVTGFEPPSLPKNTNAYRFAGFGIHEIVIYYDLFRYLLGECFENDITEIEQLEGLADNWRITPQPEFSGKTPAHIVESERRRENLTVSAHECLIDEDCPVCVEMSEIFDTPMFWHLDGSQMEYDRFEFSFYKTLEEWEAKQREMEKFNREFAEGKWRDNSDFDDFGEILI